MHQHHRRTIERLVERYASDPDTLALVVIGSVARGEAREDSDVDAYLIVSDEAYTAHRAGAARRALRT